MGDSKPIYYLNEVISPFFCNLIKNMTTMQTIMNRTGNRDSKKYRSNFKQFTTKETDTFFDLMVVDGAHPNLATTQQI